MKAASALVLAWLTASCGPRERALLPPTAAQRSAAISADPHRPASYLDLPIGIATQRADAADIPNRVIEVDGSPRPATLDYRPNRLNFAIRSGTVIRVTQG